MRILSARCGLFFSGAFTLALACGPGCHDASDAPSSDGGIITPPGEASDDTWLGTLEFGSTDNEAAYASVVDSKKNVYVIGATHGQLVSGDAPSTSQWFVTKLSPSGRRIWTKQFNTNAAVRATLAPDDGVYVAGEGGLVRMDGDGNTVWAVMPQRNIKDLVVGPDGDIWITGVAGEDSPTDANSLPPIGALRGVYDAFVFRVSAADGSIKSRQLVGSSDGDWANAIAVGKAGEVYIAGPTQGELPGATHVGAMANVNAYLMRIEPDGKLGWTRQFGFLVGVGAGAVRGNDANAVRLDAAGNIYVAGKVLGELDTTDGGKGEGGYVARFDATGTRTWISYIPHGTVNDLAIDASSHAWVAGTSLAYYSMAYAASFDPTGAQTFFQFFADSPAIGKASTTDLWGTYQTNGWGIGLDPAGFAYVVGEVTGELDGNLNASEPIANSNPGDDVFVAKLDASGAIQGVAMHPVMLTLELAAGATATVSAPPSDAKGAAVSAAPKWTSSNPAVATVDDMGHVVAVAKGHAYLTPTIGRAIGEPVRVSVPTSGLGTAMFGTRHGDVPRSVVLDSSDAPLIAGWTEDATGAQPYAGGHDAFVAKLDAKGSATYLAQVNGSGNDEIIGIAADAAGNTYASMLGSDPLPSAKQFTGGLVVSSDAAGKHRWTYDPNVIVTGERITLRGITADSAGNSYVTGYGNGGVVAIKIDPAGHELFRFATTSVSIGRNASGEAIALDASGNIVLAGIAEQGTQFERAIVLKLDKDGTTLLWFSFINVLLPAARAVAVDAPTGDIVFAGAKPNGRLEDNSGPYRGMSGYIARVSGTDGSLKWRFSPGIDKGLSNVNVGIYGLALDSAGNVYGAGSAEGDALDGATLGGSDAVLVKLDATGAQTWARQLTTKDNDYATALALKKNGDVVLVGYTFGAFDGGSIRGPATKQNCDIFVAQFGADGSRK